jgi:hypothetical protein
MVKREDIINRLADKGYTKKSAAYIIDDFVRVIAEALVEGEEADPDAVDSAEADEPDDADDPDEEADPEGESDSATAPDGSVAPAQNPAGPAS